MPHLGMEFLGLFQASLDGTPLLTFESNKVRALLAYLATESQRPHPRESLAALIWPDWPDRAALSNLRYALSDLRKVIGDRTATPPFLLINREAIQFNPSSEHALDVAMFTALAEEQDPQQLARAITLYQGEFLEGFSVSEAAPFESWVRLKREQFHRTILETLYRTAAILNAREEYESALPYARRQVEIEPLDESAQRQLMVLLARNGRSAEALAQYKTCEDVLKKELGARPSQETEDLYNLLLKGENPPEEVLSAERYRTAQDSRYHPKQALQFSEPDLEKVDVHPNNLPVQLTSFIGREREMGEIKKILAGTHLLTLTGVGGTGKTRLALQVSADLIDEFQDGVWLVELAPLQDPALVEKTVAALFRVRGKADIPLSELLVEHIQRKRLLLILDNCEHVVEACAQLAEFLLRKAPEVKILATSRVHLNLAGEVNYPVPPLILPDPERSGVPSELAHCEAVRLYVERALAVQPAFILKNENAPAVVQICRQLDGIPLAIELAAARMRILSPDQISAHLNDRFNLLTGGSRTALPRHQTLRATMDWSYGLLGEPEQTLLRRLAVFPGSFTLEAVEEICNDERDNASLGSGISKHQVLDLLGSLVDHSLVSVQEKDSGVRYFLLETVRQYALEKLDDSGEIQLMRDHHLAYYLDFIMRLSPRYDCIPPDWIGQCEPEFDNFRAAMEYAIEHHPQTAIQLEIPFDLLCTLISRDKEAHDWAMKILDLTESWPLGEMRTIAVWRVGDTSSCISDYQHGQAWLETSYEMAMEIGNKRLITNILNDLFFTKWHQDDWASARKYAEQRLAIAQELNDKACICSSLSQMGNTFFKSGDFKKARVYFEQALDIARQENNLTAVSWDLKYLGCLEYLEGNTTQAIECFTECVQTYRRLRQLVQLAYVCLRFGSVLLQQGRVVQAGELFEESLRLIKKLKMVEDYSGLYYLLGTFGIAIVNGQYAHAARLEGAIEVVEEKSENYREEFYHRIYDPQIATIREQLGETNFNAALAEGRELTLEQALDLAKTM
jgi:predicted ATPase/DNA-binding SARP family transcriptional activator